MKKRFFILIVLFFYSLIFVKILGEEENKKQIINFEELSSDFKKAYELFEKSYAADVGEYTYKRAIDELKKVYDKTNNEKEKIMCSFLISFSYFLDGEIKEAIDYGYKCFDLCMKNFKDIPEILTLKDIKMNIENGNIKGISDISSFTSLGKDVFELTSELFKLYEGVEDLDKMKKECWERYKNNFDKKIEILNKEYNLENIIEVKNKLEEKYKKKGWFLDGELKEDFIKFAFEKIVE